MNEDCKNIILVNNIGNLAVKNKFIVFVLESANVTAPINDNPMIIIATILILLA